MSTTQNYKLVPQSISQGILFDETIDLKANTSYGNHNFVFFKPVKTDAANHMCAIELAGH